MNNFFVIDWDDGSSDCYRKDELVVDGITGRVLKQFKNEMCMGKIASFHSTKAGAKKELKDRTEAPHDVASVAEASSKRERTQTARMVEFTHSTVENSSSKEKETVETSNDSAPVKKNTPKNSSTEAEGTSNESTPVKKSTTKNSSKTVNLKKKKGSSQENSTSKTNESKSVKKRKRNETVDTERPSTSKDLSHVSDMLMESLLKDLEDEDDQLGQIQETSTLSVIGEAISMSVDVDGNDSDDTSDEPLPCSSTPVHSRPEPQEVLKPMPRYPNSEHQGCSKCDRLAVTVENLQKQILDQNNNMYQLHLRLYQMEQYQYNSQSHNTQNQNGQSYISQTNNQTSNVQANEMQRMLVTPKSPSQLRSTERCEPVPTQVLYNGFTKAQLNHDLPGRGWKQDSKWLLRRMFTTEELKGHSITGHHGSKKKTNNVRPPLEDKSKLRVLYDIIIEKYPGRLVTDINLVLADVVKPSAPGMAE